MKTLYTLSLLLKSTPPDSLNLACKVLKGDTVRLQPWFTIRRVSWLCIVAYTNGCHKDQGDWLHRGLLHSFWWREVLVWNLVFISPGGQFGHRYVIPMATRHIVQSSPKMEDGVSFFFKMESARPVPFLAHHLPGSPQPHMWPRSTSQPLLSVHTWPCPYLDAALVSGQWLFIEILSTGLWVCPVSFVSVSSVLQQYLKSESHSVVSCSL